ncbi:MAG TPA: hypothetical protein VGN32_21325 [Ktedonobacterales bacterium]|nr:hypothetical protein [Ktedonobacterales bacterium]
MVVLSHFPLLPHRDATHLGSAGGIGWLALGALILDGLFVWGLVALADSGFRHRDPLEL